MSSRKLQGFERSYLEAKFATPGITLTEPQYRDEKPKNVISRKLQVFEK